MEREMDEEHRREIQRQKDREAEKERLRKQQLEERDRRQQDDIKKMNVASDEKERLLREHEEQMNKMRSNMEQEQAKGRANLQARLEARRKNRVDSNKAKLEKESLLDITAEHREDLLRKQAEDDLTSKLPLGGSTDSTPGMVGGSGTPGSFVPTGNQEQDWVNMLMMSPLFKQINDLAEMLDKTPEGAVSSDKILGMML